MVLDPPGLDGAEQFADRRPVGGTGPDEVAATERDEQVQVKRRILDDDPEPVRIETPVAPMQGMQLAGKKLVFAPILRAGVGFLDGMLSLVPSARVAHIGLYRDPKTLVAVEYYFKAPEDVTDRLVLVLDPMLATG
ncbi:MAG: hypothetical protein F9K43_23135, partial [Bauldia sp.]